MRAVRIIGSSLLLGVTAAACAPHAVWPPLRDSDEIRMARSVTIVRDEWGVPTIYGPTDAAVAFGAAWAQAEDDFGQLEDEYIRDLGWASAWYGERDLDADLVRAAFDVIGQARAEYEREPAARRALWDAYAAGLNHYMRTTGVRARVIARYEPWMIFARHRMLAAGDVIDGVRLGVISATAARGAEYILVGRWTGENDDAGAAAAADQDASLAWAIAPRRTAEGHAVLLQHAHAPFFGSGQYHELHLHSSTGWQVRGVARLGTPVPFAGQTPYHAWALTRAAADHADVYEVIFDHPTDPLLYRYDGEWRRAEEWEHAVHVNTAAGVVTRTYRFRRTHHGPIVAEREGRALALRVVRWAEGGALQQMLDMGRANSLESFRAALDQRALARTATMYADARGNIHFVHGSAVPARDTAVDWMRPVSGNTSATEWRGVHALDDLPQLLNPPAGWLQSAGGSPFNATRTGDNLDPARYPRYMATESWTERERRSHRLLEADSAWDRDALKRAAFDTYVGAEHAVAPLVQEWEVIGGVQPRRAMRIDEAVDRLRSWDRVATTTSVETTLFVLWQERLRNGTFTGAERHFRAMEHVVEQLEAGFGRVTVPWGEINRLQRVQGRGSFGTDEPSLPLAAAPAWTGSIHAVESAVGTGGMRFAIGGSSWVSIVALGASPRALAVMHFGQSADRTSPHFFDQAPLYARGEMRPAPLTREEVAAGAQRVYQPGDVQQP